MHALFVSIVLISCGGMAAVICRRTGLSNLVGSITLLVGSALGLFYSVGLLSGMFTTEIKSTPWSVPFGMLTLGVDPLSAFFLTTLFLIAIAVSLYGYGYLAPYHGKKDLGLHWCLLNLFIASMVLVLTAQNAVFFLYTWEAMSIFSFFLVTFEHERLQVRRAGFVYLIATHIGTGCLLMAFILLGLGQGSFEFASFAISGTTANAVFLLALIGFGTKAGIVPLHVWLPEAHPAAPSHVSALMSAVMIKLGIYGLLRILTFVDTTPAWWGFLLIAIGASSGIIGVLFALGQHDIKRLLAYHSVENIGIIVIGIGLGVIGNHYHAPLVSVLGFGGALLHVLNHALFKGLLFLGAGAVYQRTHIRELDHLGGLLKRMPLTGTFFLLGSVAICGLPPLNGFISEFFIYSSAFAGLVGWGGVNGSTLEPGIIAGSVLAITSLALIGGLAVACFTKAFGTIFLGEPRVQGHNIATEVQPCMTIPMGLLAVLCTLIGLTFYTFLELLVEPIAVLAQFSKPPIARSLFPMGNVLFSISVTYAVLFLLLISLMLFRKVLLMRRKVREGITWDCGYVAPSASMQYSSSSFAQPLVDFFDLLLQSKKHRPQIHGFFPRRSSFHSEVRDVFFERLFRNPSTLFRTGVLRLVRLQPVRVNYFAGYIIVTLLILIVWNFLWGGNL